MLNKWSGTCMPERMIFTSENKSMLSNDTASRLNHEHAAVEGDGTFFPASEDQMIRVENLIAEPISDKVQLDAVLCFGNENPGECLGIEDFPGADDHNNQLKADNGAMLSHIACEWSDVPNFGFLDGMLQGGYDADFHVKNDLSSEYGDFLSGTQYVAKASEVDYDTYERPHSGNVGFESCSPGFRDCNIGGADRLNISTSTIAVPISDPNVHLLNKMTIRELQKAFSSIFGRETTVKNKQWLIRRISFGLQNLVNSEKGLVPLGSEIFCKKLDQTMALASHGSKIYSSSMDSNSKPVDISTSRSRFPGMDVHEISCSGSKSTELGILGLRERNDIIGTRKRLRKPTRRYIEEMPNLKSRCSSGKLDAHLTSYNQHYTKGYGSTSPDRNEDSVVIYDHKEHDNGENKNDRLVLEPNHSTTDVEPSLAESQDDMSDDHISRVRTTRGRSRRKNHRLWTLSEVMKLVDGVSRYGVGRWTEIKRLLFASSAHRTSVDLKDKWRNLLRASEAHLKNKRKVEQGRKNASQPIPQSVLWRVGELSIIHPYPRERKTKLPGMSTVAIPSPCCRQL